MIQMSNTNINVGSCVWLKLCGFATQMKDCKATNQSTNHIIIFMFLCIGHTTNN